VETQLILDRYRPLEELGEGGYGSVVSAWDTRMQRRVAIKRLPLPLDAAGRPLKRAGLAEARTGAMLNHPSIITVYDFDTDEDEAFLITELIDGASLEEVLAELAGPLNLDEAAAVLGPVFDAVEFAHANGVLHLDLKPANVLVDRDGRVKVADFGVSTLSSLGGHGPALAATLGYAPLEQLEGTKVTERSDEWSLAVLAYELLTAENPFAAADIDEAVALAERLQPLPPSRQFAGIPPAVDEALLCALEPAPLERFADVRGLGGALLPKLGDPSLGRDSLAEIVGRVAGEEPTENASLAKLGLWDRIGNRGWLLGRLAAALVCGWAAWFSLAEVATRPLALVAAAGLTALAAGFAPRLGGALALVALVIGLLVGGVPVAAALVLVLGAAYWWFVGRHSEWAALLPFAAPLLAVLQLTFVAPLLAGFILPPIAAAAAAFASGVLTLLAAVYSFAGEPFLRVDAQMLVGITAPLAKSPDIGSVLTQAPTWIALAAWPLSATVMSLLARRGSRAGALLGTAAGGAILWGGYRLAQYVFAAQNTESGAPIRVLWTGSGFTVPLIASLILVVLVSLLGPPLRGEEEHSHFRPEPEED
jgi:Protein kinase domain